VIHGYNEICWKEALLGGGDHLRLVPLDEDEDGGAGEVVVAAAVPVFASGVDVAAAAVAVVLVAPPGPMLPKPRLWKSSLSIRLLVAQQTDHQ
jgi:hypothetical protein